MTTVRRALALSMIERLFLIVMALANSVVIARLLTPEDIGIYSVSLAIIGIAQVLRDFGIGNFLIQEKSLSEAHIRTAFGMSLVLGGVLFLVVYSAAPLASSYYNERQLIETMRISAVNFLVLPFCTVSLALLRRDMAFGRLMIVTLLATAISFIVIVILALRGYGANSMAVGAVVGNILTGIGAWVARGSNGILLPGMTEWRSMLRFGTQSSIASIVTSVAMDINDLVLGKLLGFSSVAMISRAQGLMNLFHRELMSAIRNVAFPSYAKAFREGESLESRYISSVTMVTVVAWPFYGFVGLFAFEIVRLMFGPQWDEAVSLVPVFCLAGAFAATNNLITSVMTASGRIDLVTKTELLFQPCRVALIVLAALLFKSLLACSIAYAISFALQTPLLYFFKEKCLKSNYKELLEKLWLSARVAGLSLGVPAVLSIYQGLGRDEPIGLGLFAVAVICSLVSWLAAVKVCAHPLADEQLFVRWTRNLPGFRE